MKCNRVSFLLVLPLLFSYGGAACYGQPMARATPPNHGPARPEPVGIGTGEPGPADDVPTVTAAPRRPGKPPVPVRAPRPPSHRFSEATVPSSPTLMLAEAMRPYVADAPLDRPPGPPPVRTNGRSRPPQQSAQQANGNVRLYVLVGAAVLAAGWVSYAVLARSENEGLPPEPPPRPQPQ